MPEKTPIRPIQSPVPAVIFATQPVPVTQEALPVHPVRPAQKQTPKRPDPARPVRVLFAASECVPFVKTGGLADVLGALPKELKKLGADVRVILPKYTSIPDEFKRRMIHVCDFPIPLGWRSQYCGIEALEMDGLTYYFVDNEYYFGRSYIYGHACNDEAERFAFFSKAVLDCMPHIGFFPDVLHAHDWQAAMSVALLKLQYNCLVDYARIRALFTIHNLRYQGVFEWPFVSELLSLGGGCFHQDCLEYYGKTNFMKAALVLADAVTTVSPSYATEIQSGGYGETLDGVLRARGRVSGILNGLDESLYDPATDPHTAAHFSARDIAGKALC
ncbi:MAG: glycogen synthase, partial [Clostridia bacterium]|nr:glycogen synthase [Clostridia bacterium]